MEDTSCGVLPPHFSFPSTFATLQRKATSCQISSPFVKKVGIWALTSNSFFKTVTYKGVPIRLSAGFSKEALQARRGCTKIFKIMKGKDLQPRLLYPAKLSFRMEGQIKCFPDNVKLKEFIITKPLLYEMLKGLI